MSEQTDIPADTTADTAAVVEKALSGPIAPWVFLVLLAATGLSAGISLSMISAPHMLSSHEGAGMVPLFLAIGAVYLGMPVTWLLGVATIGTFARTGRLRVTKAGVIAAAVWTGVLAVPFVSALLR